MVPVASRVVVDCFVHKDVVSAVLAVVNNNATNSGLFGCHFGQ